MGLHRLAAVKLKQRDRYYYQRLQPCDDLFLAALIIHILSADR